MSETWTFVCATGELLPGEMRPVFDEVTGTPILVVNLDGDLYALEDRCSHEDFELSAGAIDPADGSIECVLHGARFDLRDGRALCAPAYSPVPKFPVKIEDGNSRASEAVIAALLARVGALDPAHPVLSRYVNTHQRNWRGIETGSIRLASGLF